MSPNNTDSPPNLSPTGASNNPRYLHNESTPTSAPLLKASVEQSIFNADCCTAMPNPFPREYPSDSSFFSQTTSSHRLSSCPQTIYGARTLRHHGAMGRRRCNTQGSPKLSFPTPMVYRFRVPSTRVGLSHGNNGTAINSPAYVPNFTYNVAQDQDQPVFSGTNRVIGDVQQQLQTSIPAGKKRSNIGAMGVEYGFSHANVKFNNRQHSRSLSSLSCPMPVRNTSKRICVRAAASNHDHDHDAAQGQTQIQSSTGKVSDSTSAKVKRHSTYSPSVSVDGTRWHCNGCEYTAEREQDMTRHCSTLRHGGHRFFACPSCGKRFSRKDSVTRHSKKTGCGLLRAPLMLSGSSA